MNPLKRNASGFTVMELVVALLLLAILIVIAISIYLNYVNKAKVTIAESTLIHLRDHLNLYNIDNSKFPNLIDFTHCVDEANNAVLSKSLCDQIKSDLHSVSYTYNANTSQYEIIGRAKDRKLTIIKVTPEKISRDDI